MSINRWDSPRYQRMLEAGADNDHLVVRFEDGTQVSVLKEQLLPFTAVSPRWDELRVTPFEIVIPAAGGEREIPWTTVRLLTDREFAHHAANVAEEQARDIGLRIRELRTNRGLTAKEVAERAGITPQSLSRIERGHHDVVYTTLEKILAAMGSNLSELAKVNVPPSSLSTFLKRVQSLGLKREWVTERLLPETLLQSLESADAVQLPKLLEVAARCISRIFGWDYQELLSSAPLRIDLTVAHAARFKTQGRTLRPEALAYASYARFLANLALEATSHLDRRTIPDDPRRIREMVVENYGAMAFENLLRLVWDHGIPVIPLNDSGAFHGACWHINKADVIVLKQMTPYQARWLYDLSHEMGHVTKHLKSDDSWVIEIDELSPFKSDSDEELEANSFASELLLFGRAEELTQMCVEVARGRVEYLKSAVLQVANREHVPVDVLANYAAYRLSLQGLSWWGAANNLQVTEPAPFRIAREILLEKISLDFLAPEDQDLLIRAIQD